MMSSGLHPAGGLQKKTNWWGAFVIGLAGTILVTGVAPFAVQSMGGLPKLPFFFVTGAGVIWCFFLAELAAMMPDRTGARPSYAFEPYKVFEPGMAKLVCG